MDRSPPPATISRQIEQAIADPLSIEASDSPNPIDSFASEKNLKNYFKNKISVQILISTKGTPFYCAGLGKYFAAITLCGEGA